MDRANGELSRLSQVIGLIYEGATDPSRWTADIMPAIADYIEAPACILYSPLHTPKNGGYFFIHGITQEHVDLYVQKYYAEDLWKNAATERNLYITGNVVLGDELVPRAQLLASRFYKDCLSLNKNMAQAISGTVFGMDSSTSVPAICSFFRGLHHPDFDEESRNRMRLVLPHLSRSLGVMQRLRSAELTMATTLAALDRLPAGALLLDGAGRVNFANNAARRMLEKSNGLHLQKPAQAAGLGKLDADDLSISRALIAAIKATLERDPYDTPHFSQSMVVPQRSGLGSYTLQFSALGSQNEFGGEHSGHAAIVFIADSTRKQVIEPAVLQSAYGLTAAEARVAITLLEHVSAKEVANILAVSPHTVRTQIRDIYTKLGVDTRTRFVKAMWGLASQRA